MTAPTERWYEEGLPFSCTACGNCCKSHGEYSHVYLREEEAFAIADHLGLGMDTFAANHLETEDGWLLLRQGETQCPFLSSEGRCGIYEVRPVQCRTWPFWTINLEKSAWSNSVNSICPGSRSGEIHDADTVERIAQGTEDWYEDRIESWPGPRLEPGSVPGSQAPPGGDNDSPLG